MAILIYTGNGHATLDFSIQEREVVEENTEAFRAYVTVWLQERFTQFMGDRFEKMADADRLAVIAALKEGAGRGRS
jgi:hypothetical protein